MWERYTHYLVGDSFYVVNENILEAWEYHQLQEWCLTWANNWIECVRDTENSMRDTANDAGDTNNSVRDTDHRARDTANSARDIDNSTRDWQ